jgi:hypothetical protein
MIDDIEDNSKVPLSIYMCIVFFVLLLYYFCYYLLFHQQAGVMRVLRISHYRHVSSCVHIVCVCACVCMGMHVCAMCACVRVWVGGCVLAWVGGWCEGGWVCTCM